MAIRTSRFAILPIAVVMLLLAIGFLQPLAGAEQRVSPPISVGRVELDETFVFAGTDVWGFVPTSSSSDKCIATLSESDFAVPGTVLFCNRRIVNGTPGVAIHIFLDRQLPPDFIFLVNVYQEFAAGYGPPVPCTQVVGC